ncbi:MAG: FAD-dependent oxidoreductase [Candidatus Aureabacteria bacterium]|nr:FAD-dependent oxidoreductase [Candidatus Auribacterota bacterium]
MGTRDYDYDVVVIEGGAGGLFAASAARAMGAGACIAEKSRLGGDCTWFGCMPSKALLKSAAAAHLLKRLPEFGVRLRGDVTLDVRGVMGHVRDVVREISTHHPPELFEKGGIAIRFGAPRFVSEDAIDLDGVRIKARRFIICTGSRPLVPPIQGLQESGYLTNETIFDLDSPPGSLIVLGGEPIGVELAQSMNRLGTEVHIVEMGERILPREDSELSAVLAKALHREGIDLLTRHKALRVEKIAGSVKMVIEGPSGVQREIIAVQLLVAIGRAPNVDGLSLKSAGVAYSRKGITVNDYLQTANKAIFACGDVAGPYMFSHMAAYQAQLCVRNALLRRPFWKRVNYAHVPWATFTEPELARVGATEDEARAVHPDARAYTSPYDSSDRAVTDIEKEGFVKVIADRKGRILGAHIAGAHASEIIHSFIIGSALRLPLSALSKPIFIYPTLSEIVKKTAAKPLLEKLGSAWSRRALHLLRKV